LRVQVLAGAQARSYRVLLGGIQDNLTLNNFLFINQIKFNHHWRDPTTSPTRWPASIGCASLRESSYSNWMS